MHVLTAPDGSFAFVFSKDEKELGLTILEGFVPTNEEGKKNLEESKSRIITAGEEGTMQ